MAITPTSPLHWNPLRTWLKALRTACLLALVALTTVFFLLPGLSVSRDLTDEALRGPGVPRRAWRLHRDLTPRIERWSRARIASGQAAHVALHDVPTTEWPLFTSVFYLLATENLQASWDQGDHFSTQPPAQYGAQAVQAAKDLLLDPNHHTWVRTHWGEGYMHKENVFFRSLLIAGLTSYEKLTHDGTTIPLLRDQVESLAASLDRSEHGVLHDYPGECYPIDVLAAIGFLRRADVVLGTDHSAFVARSLRAFEGSGADNLGLVPYRVNLDTGTHDQASRGIGNSWILVFAPDLWPGRAQDWYTRYEKAFWQDRVWAAGFREFSLDARQPEWMMEVDAGPVLDGFGTSASAFGIAAARRNGRLDHGYTLAAQMLAVSWPLPEGTLLGPRLLSHATDAPYLGESGILYFLTVTPTQGVPVVKGGTTPGLVWFFLLVYFGVSALVSLGAARRLHRLWQRPSPQI